MKEMRNLCQAAFLSASIVWIGNSTSGSAATANVQVGSISQGNVFVPAITNITANDRVIWTWVTSLHNVTSTNNTWVASPTQNAPSTFTNTFTTPGNYFYFCSIHGSATAGMKGEIIVTGGNTPPTVTVTNPAPGAIFAAPANVTIQASASDSGGSVTNVQFLVDSTSLGNDTTAPYSAVANSLTAGSHTLFAIATDNNGATATNSVSISVVNPSPILLSAPTPQPAGNFQFSFTADTGLRYVVQRSTDLLSSAWINLGTNLAGGSSVTYTDLNTKVSPAFYRVGRLPNP